MTVRWSLVALIVLTGSPLVAQEQPAANLTVSINNLAAFDYATRLNAARTVRRAPSVDAVPALAQAARGHADQFVRYRALILLTAFDDRATPGLMRTLLADRNDRVRETAYRWFERRPDPALAETLLAALNTEQAEFVRPALIRAVAALAPEDRVRRALTAEVGRGLDFFRSAVIEALGEHRAAYALPALASVAVVDGPLQDDAVLALGRIGDARAVPTLASVTDGSREVIPALQAAQCLLGDACDARIAWLAQAAVTPPTHPETARAAVAALGAVASQGHAAAIAALVGLKNDEAGRVRGDVALALSGAALRRPNDIVLWLGRAEGTDRASGIDLLREGFEGLEEDFLEEQFFAHARAAYWNAPEGSATRTLAAALIDQLEF